MRSSHEEETTCEQDTGEPGRGRREERRGEERREGGGGGGKGGTGMGEKRGGRWAWALGLGRGPSNFLKPDPLTGQSA